MAFDTAILEVGVMFAAIAIGGALAGRINQARIPIYIIVGMLVGPYVLGELGLPHVGMTSGIDHFIEVAAEIGIVFLLFFLGLEFSLQRLLENKRRIGKAGFLDLFNLIVGILLGYFLLGDVIGALLVGGIVYISSSAIITKSLIDIGWIANEESESMLGILVYEDLFIAFYIAFISALLLESGSLAGIASSMAISAVFIAILLFLVYRGTSFFQKMIESKSNELLVLRVVGVLVFISGAALVAGVSEAVAAFFVGMTFSDTEYADDIEHLLEPIRYVFAAVFFFWIGMVTDPTQLTEIIPLLVIAVIITGIVKFFTGYGGGKIYDLDVRRSTRVGLGMITRGEFSLVIAAIASASIGAFSNDVVTHTIPAFAVGYVLVMSILGTSLMHYSEFFEKIVIRLVGQNNSD